MRFQGSLVNSRSNSNPLVRIRSYSLSSSPVRATVIALVPLASHGGPLWKPLCYAEIGGLTVATFVTLLLVPVIYSIFVMDLKLVRWDENKNANQIPVASHLP